MHEWSNVFQQRARIIQERKNNLSTNSAKAFGYPYVEKLI